MTDNLHPLTQEIYEKWAPGFDPEGEPAAQLDGIVRSYLDSESVKAAQSNVRFPEAPDVPIEVAGNFILSSYGQLQMVMVGTEPVILIQPEYDAEEGSFNLITTAVDLAPAGLVIVLEALLDGVKTIVAIEEQEAAFATYEVQED